MPVSAGIVFCCMLTHQQRDGTLNRSLAAVRTLRAMLVTKLPLTYERLHFSGFRMLTALLSITCICSSEIATIRCLLHP